MVLPNDHAKSSCKCNGTIWATEMNTIEHEICVLFRNITLGVNHHHQFLCTFCCKDLLKEVLFINNHSSSNVNLDFQIRISNESRWRVHLITKKHTKIGFVARKHPLRNLLFSKLGLLWENHLLCSHRKSTHQNIFKCIHKKMFKKK